jgi:hypothetical protein
MIAGVTDLTGEIVTRNGIRWRSLDAEIATVDSNGVVRAHQLGLATVVVSRGRDTATATVVVTPPVLVGTGDIASCASSGDEATAAILDTIKGVVMVIGDIAYETGSTEEFAQCYHPSWGRHRARTRPAPGNHEYYTADAGPYFEYFGPNAGPAGRGYYSYNLGSWHVVVLNSSAATSHPSPQIAWLRRDLAASTARCTIAYFHYPLFTSGPNGPNDKMLDAWRVLYEFGADVIVNGHDHVYERFAPQDPAGNPDPVAGIRQFTVGTGGRSLYSLFTIRERNSEVGHSGTYGVLKLTLHPSSYDWAFIPVIPGRFHDAGSAPCH